jgi:phosphoribosylamine--glycine ligase
VTVVIAAQGYPEHPVKGDKIKIFEAERAVVPQSVQNYRSDEQAARAYVLHAGTAIDADGDLVSAGGRVLNVVGSGTDIAAARAAAYELAATIAMPGGWYRHDIAAGR